MSVLSDVICILTIDCRQSSRLTSESLDRPLRWPERVALRMHRLGCWSCRRLKRQLAFLHDAARRLDREQIACGCSESDGLSTEAKQRMKTVLKVARDQHSG